MARNRLLFDLLGTVAGLGIMIPMAIFLNTGNYGTLGFTTGGVILGGLVLGFLAYKSDGVKIAGAISGLMALFGIVVGVIMFAAGETFAQDLADDIFGALIGGVGAILLVVIGIIFIVVMIVASLIFVGTAAIGSAIGEAVWKDKAGEQTDVSAPYQPVQPAQATYQPVQPAQATYQPVEKPVKQAGEVFCTNCGATNNAADEFCTSCGGKLKKQ
ncbi:MAG: hypothetical protein GOP50_03615 [Candidatus Heimdallarchaeota archaeon]|nr:hypothetical protein [Candidatus Heimdallarchaeota archaeon]